MRGNFFKTALALITALVLAVASYTFIPSATASVGTIPSSFQVPDQSLGFLLEFNEGDQESSQSEAAFEAAVAASPLLALAEPKAIGLGWYSYSYGVEAPAKAQVLAAVNAAMASPGVLSIAFDFKVEAARAQPAAKFIPVKTWGIAPSTSSIKLANGYEAGDPADGKIKVTWTRPTSTAKRYQVAYSTGKYGPWKYASVTSSSYKPSVKIGGLIPGTRYYFKVRVKYSSTRYSNYTSNVSGRATVQPFAVKLISSSRFTNTTSVSVQWFPLTSVIERGGASTVTYRMDVYNSSNDLFVGSCLPTAATYCTKDQLPLGNYYAKVYAINSVAETATNVSSENFGYQSLWYLTGNKGINVKTAWALSQGGANTVTVAVIDTGFTNAPVLKANAWWDYANNHFYGYDFLDNTAKSPSNDGNGADNDPSDPGDYYTDPDTLVTDDSSWHGTQVGSVLAGYTNFSPNALTSTILDANSSIGVAPRVKLLAVRALGPTGGSTSEITAAINWAAGVQIPGYPLNLHPAKVINLSMGTSGVQACDSYDLANPSPSPSPTQLTTAQKFRNQLTYTQDAIVAARDKGVIFTTAAGNYGYRYMRAISSYPGNCYGTINVGATGKTGTRTWYSNLGSGTSDYSGIDISAPGGDSSFGAGGLCDQASCITVTLNTGTTSPTDEWSLGINEGTSFAAPVVAGVVAMMVSVDPTLEIESAVDLLNLTATPFVSGPCSVQLSPTYFECGVGIVNASAAVQ
ncbi:MAG: S8 family serine peptidase, partial [Micrococcales bacterium]